MSGELVFDVRKLTKRLGSVAEADNLDLKAPRGVIYGLLGPNGSGKATTIRMVCGLLRPDGGDGGGLGFDLKRDRKKIKARICCTTQRFSLYEELGLKDALIFLTTGTADGVRRKQ
ncbi:MAG: ATP-binding cassette domain-containing protein [Parvularculaceae bacterium]